MAEMTIIERLADATETDAGGWEKNQNSTDIKYIYGEHLNPTWLITQLTGGTEECSVEFYYGDYSYLGINIKTIDAAIQVARAMLAAHAAFEKSVGEGR